MARLTVIGSICTYSTVDGDRPSFLVRPHSPTDQSHINIIKRQSAFTNKQFCNGPSYIALSFSSSSSSWPHHPIIIIIIIIASFRFAPTKLHFCSPPPRRPDPSGLHNMANTIRGYKSAAEYPQTHCENHPEKNTPNDRVNSCTDGENAETYAELN